MKREFDLSSFVVSVNNEKTLPVIRKRFPSLLLCSLPFLLGEQSSACDSQQESQSE